MLQSTFPMFSEENQADNSSRSSCASCSENNGESDFVRKCSRKRERISFFPQNDNVWRNILRTLLRPFAGPLQSGSRLLCRPPPSTQAWGAASSSFTGIHAHALSTDAPPRDWDFENPMLRSKLQSEACSFGGYASDLNCNVQPRRMQISPKLAKASEVVTNSHAGPQGSPKAQGGIDPMHRRKDDTECLKRGASQHDDHAKTSTTTCAPE